MQELSLHPERDRHVGERRLEDSFGSASRRTRTCSTSTPPLTGLLQRVDERTARDRDGTAHGVHLRVRLHESNGHGQVELTASRHLPRSIEAEVAVGGVHRPGLAVDGHRRTIGPRRDPQRERPGRARGLLDANPYTAVPRQLGVEAERDRSGRQLGAVRPGAVQVQLQAAVGSGRGIGVHRRDQARDVRRAAGHGVPRQPLGGGVLLAAVMAGAQLQRVRVEERGSLGGDAAAMPL